MKEATAKLSQPVVGSIREFRAFKRLAGDRLSLLRFGIDIVLYRVLRLVSVPGQNRIRRIRTRNGLEIAYRLNRGDIQAIREICLDEIYRLPFELPDADVLVDFGAHIGLSAVWLTQEYGFTTVLAIEPSPSNVRLARLNFELNGVQGEVIEAAVSSTNGMISFSELEHSQLGRTGSGGREVASVRPGSAFDRVSSAGDVDLVKLDVEGAEGDLLRQDTEWLQRVQSLLVEFHPVHVDYPELARIIEGAGFRWFQAGTVLPRTTDAFRRLSTSD